MHSLSIPPLGAHSTVALSSWNRLIRLVGPEADEVSVNGESLELASIVAVARQVNEVCFDI